MKLPEQAKNIEDSAYAPYNFVPLPERVVPAEEVAPEEGVPPIKLGNGEVQAFPYTVRQDQYHFKRHTGRIVCTLVTKTPLYIRTSQTLSDFAKIGEQPFHQYSDEQKERYAQFFNHGDVNTPIIPGSSLRGMLRSLIEIAGFSKIERVFDRQLFYRSIQDGEYRKLFTETIPNVQVGANPRADAYRSLVRAGYIEQRGGTYVIRECTYARIDTNMRNPQGIAPIPELQGTQYNIRDGAAPAYQHHRIYVSIDSIEGDYYYHQQLRPQGGQRHPNMYLRFRAVKRANWSAETGLAAGRLVLTGFMQHKHLQFVFLNDTLHEYPVSSDMKERFEDDDQITQWQEKAFPQGNGRNKDGGLRDGEPVFFLLDDDGAVRFFGRAQLFRLPYGAAPLHFVPDELRFGEGGTERSPIEDLAEAIFGFVRQKNSTNAQTGAGRVTVSDAHFSSATGSTFLSETSLSPKILASPKPTTYQHYLVQGRPPHHRYDSQLGRTVIRGHKLYWHRNKRTQADLEEQDVAKIQRTPKQYTRTRPINSGVHFEFTIHFENLSATELGALLWVLRIAADPDHCLNLGMGKPLGMGAVAIHATTYIHDRTARYTHLLDQDTWVTGEGSALDSDQTAQIEQAFHRHILGSINEQKIQRIDELPRIKDLLRLLAWPGPDPVLTRYMEIERSYEHPEGVHPTAGRVNNQGKQNEYTNRPILANPSEIYPDDLQNKHRNERLERERPQPTRKIEIGEEVKGNRKGWYSDTPRGRCVRVELNLKDFRLPKGKAVIGLIERQFANNQQTGGVTSIIYDVEVERDTIYLFLKPK